MKRDEGRGTPQHAPGKTKKLSDIKGSDVTRISTNISELDRVLGGGIVPGSLILLGGEPGIGKSTLSAQLAQAVPNTLYISGEESIEQVKMRMDRLQRDVSASSVKTGQCPVSTDRESTLNLSNETNVETIVATIKHNKPTLAIIDSIQTIYSNEATGETGNTTQIRACTSKLLECA